MILRGQERLDDLRNCANKISFRLMEAAIGIVPEVEVNNDRYAVNEAQRFAGHLRKLDSIKQRYEAALN